MQYKQRCSSRIPPEFGSCSSLFSARRNFFSHTQEKTQTQKKKKLEGTERRVGARVYKQVLSLCTVNSTLLKSNGDRICRSQNGASLRVVCTLWTGCNILIYTEPIVLCLLALVSRCFPSPFSRDFSSPITIESESTKGNEGEKGEGKRIQLVSAFRGECLTPPTETIHDCPRMIYYNRVPC